MPSSRRCGALPAFERFSRLNAMLSILKKATARSQRQDITVFNSLSILLRYFYVK
jgi:hypothetical protein